MSDKVDAWLDYLNGHGDMPPRPLYVIAEEIIADWHPVWFGAVPYLDAMRSLRTIHDKYGADSAQEIVAKFIGNAKYWKGDTARRIKAELRAILATL